MRFICAPDSFKESMTAPVAASAMARGIRSVLPAAEVVELPLADGGEGTAATLAAALGGELVLADCHDALGAPRQAGYGFVSSRRLAVIEVAAACGLEQVPPHRRDPFVTTTYGVGELVLDALERGAGRLIIGLGGSATNDAGAGMLSALGGRLLDASGRELPPGGRALAQLASVDLSGLDPRLAAAEVQIACDVTNPLLGPNGASAVFGPQKGASGEDVVQLDAALSNWADVVEAALDIRVRDVPGAGAAGGLGACLLAFAPHAALVPGVDLAMAAVGLAGELAGADYVFTGEGSFDAQSLGGKVPWGVARLAARAGVPVVVFAGRVADVGELPDGICAAVPICDGPATLEQALANGERNLERAVQMACRLLGTCGAGGRPSRLVP